LRNAISGLYSFIRLASLTIASKEQGSQKRAVTYYLVVRDGYSERIKTDNLEERIRLVDGGVQWVVEKRVIS
jgi:hypothetical protein